MLKKPLYLLRTQGLYSLLFAVYSKLRCFAPIRARAFTLAAPELRGKNGLEIGGYSQVFSPKGIFPAYTLAGQLDNCNFGNLTVWEGQIQSGQTFQFAPDKPAGRQYVLEATDMHAIGDARYDFVLSSHVLEHTANPLRALSEWLRVLKSGGLLIMLLPHKDGTFDHRRPVTPLAHLVADFKRNMGEDDLTHLDEILALHDLARDPEAGDFATFQARSSRNAENRCFHHHVFDTAAGVSLLDHMGLQVLAVEAMRPMHIVLLARKLPAGQSPDNHLWLQADAAFHQQSPFASDRA